MRREAEGLPLASADEILGAVRDAVMVAGVATDSVRDTVSSVHVVEPAEVGGERGRAGVQPDVVAEDTEPP